MAGESIVQVTEGSGKKLHTYQRTIGANAVEDELVIPGEHYLASYRAIGTNVAVATASSHVFQLMAGASLHVRIRRISVQQLAAPAAVTVGQIQVFRLTTAGTGGTAVTARPNDSADAAAGAAGMTLPTVKGTEGVQLDEAAIWYGTAAIPTGPLARWEWNAQPGTKPIIIPAGTTNGICLKNNGALATATLDITIEFTETSFL